jgi:hypothetical protein
MRRRTAIVTSIAAFGLTVGVLTQVDRLWRPLPEPKPKMPRLTTEQNSQLTKFLGEADIRFAPFHPVVTPKTVPAADLEKSLTANELVIGISLNGESRAYPINMINAPNRKVINDDVGRSPIIITWCDLCHTAAAYTRTGPDQQDLFACAGMVWNNMLVMYDLKTGSLWNLLAGEALAGARSGECLLPVNCVITSWGNWRNAFPETTVAVQDRVSDDVTTGYVVALANDESLVFGVHRRGGSHAWTLQTLRNERVIPTSIDGEPAVVFFDLARSTAQIFSRRVEGRDLTFEFLQDSAVDRETGSQWNLLTGVATAGKLAGRRMTPIPGVWSVASAWKQMFPSADISGAE